MIKILLSGCNGKMGQAITRVISENNDCKIVAGFDINTEKKSDYPVYDNLNGLLIDVDVIIDFSHPASLNKVLDFAISNNKPVVVATTGLSKDQIEYMKSVSKKIPVFFSANMSLGINLMIDLVCRAANALEENFDIEIIEKHHNKKIDAPSGTALAIADALSDSVRFNPEYVFDRHSVRKPRTKNEIGIHAVRGGTIVGDHSVIFAGTDEVFTISHSASSKEVFAVGAVKAAGYMVGKAPGMYSMKNLVSEI